MGQYKIPPKYAKIIIQAKSMGYKGAEKLMNQIPPKILVKIFASTQSNENIYKLFKEYDDLGKEEKLIYLIKECKKRKKDIPKYILEKYDKV